MKPFVLLLLAGFVFVAPAAYASGAQAQKRDEKTITACQQEIIKQTTPFNHYLGLGAWHAGQNANKRVEEHARATAKDVMARPEKYFSIRKVYRLSLKGRQTPQQELALELERQQRQADFRRLLLERYERLQNVIFANEKVFPGYVLAGTMDLTLLNGLNFENLARFFAATGAGDCPQISRFSRQGRVITAELDDSQQTHVIIDTKLRRISVTFLMPY